MEKKLETEDKMDSETQRFPFFNREPFRPVTEFLPQFEMNNPTQRMVINGDLGAAGVNVRAPFKEKRPPQPSDTFVSGESLQKRL